MLSAIELRAWGSGKLTPKSSELRPKARAPAHLYEKDYTDYINAVLQADLNKFADGVSYWH